MFRTKNTKQARKLFQNKEKSTLVQFYAEMDYTWFYYEKNRSRKRKRETKNFAGGRHVRIDETAVYGMY